MDKDFLHFLEEAGGAPSSRISERLGEGFVRLAVKESQIRQAQDDITCVEDGLKELLRNARDAGAKNIFVATKKSGTERKLVVIDDGSGIPKDYQDVIFEPYVTSRLESAHSDLWGFHGRGMALFSANEQFKKAQVAFSEVGAGTAVELVADTGELSENKEQSVVPRVSKEGEVRGPNNLLRVAVEFAFGEGIPVYFGSFSEVAATLLQKRLFLQSESGEVLQKEASLLGLTLSKRTAFRVLSGEIKPLQEVQALFSPSTKAQSVDLDADKRSLLLSKADKEELSQKIERVFEDLAQKYFAHIAEKPRVTYKNGQFVVSVTLKEDA